MAQAVFNVIKKGDTGDLSKLLDKDASALTATNKKQQTPLHAACENGDVGCTELLLEHNAAVNVVDKEGKTPLHLAVMNGSDDLVPLLMNHGARADLGDREGLNALHWVARMGYLALAQCILNDDENDDGGAGNEEEEGQKTAETAVSSSSSSSADGQNPDEGESEKPEAEKAAKRKRRKVDRVGLITALDNDQNSCIHIAAAASENCDLALYLINYLAGRSDCAACLNAQNKQGLTPLHLACSSGDAKVVQRLLELGSSPIAVSKSGETALQLAVLSGDVDVVKAILAAKSKAPSTEEWTKFLNRLDAPGHSALHYGCQYGKLDIIESLLKEEGIDVHVKTSPTGLTPIVLAAREKHKEVIALLERKGARMEDVEEAEKRHRDQKAEAVVAEAIRKAKGDYSSIASAGSRIPVKPSTKPPTTVAKAAAEAPNRRTLVIGLILLVMLIVPNILSIFYK